MDSTLLAALPWSTLSPAAFWNLWELLKGRTGDMCEYYAATSDD